MSNEKNIRVPEGQLDISTTIAYLLGVDMQHIGIIEDRLPICKKLENNKHARIVRNLDIVRTDIMRNHGQIALKMRNEGKTLIGMPEYISEAAVRQLDNDRVCWYRKSNYNLEMHIAEINRVILDRINNCKDLFPLWLNWDYVRQIFIMPKGLTKAGIRDALALYWRERRLYPYQMYLNWQPEDVGNILFDDQKIVSVIYEQHDDTFHEINKVCDVGNFVKDNIYLGKQKAKDGEAKRSIAERACEMWIDVRSFGQVFAFKMDEGSSAGVRGPVSIRLTESVAPVEVRSMQITKSVNGNDTKDGKKSSDTVGSKHFVQHGLYVLKGSISPQLADCTGFDDADASQIKEAIRTLFVDDMSSARPEGSMEVVKLYWWEHNSKLGQYSTAKVHRTLQVTLKDADKIPASLADYEITISDLPGLSPEILDGE